MARVTGVGGIFIKARDAESLRAWYHAHLGLEIGDWGGVVFPGERSSAGGRQTSTVWSIFPAETDYFDPSPASFMVNFRVEDLDEVLRALRSEGCEVDDRVEVSEYGRFGWVADPEGNRVELWEPPPAG